MASPSFFEVHLNAAPALIVNFVDATVTQKDWIFCYASVKYYKLTSLEKGRRVFVARLYQ